MSIIIFTHDIYEDFQQPTDILQQGLGCEEESIGHNLEAHLDTHTQHKDVLRILKYSELN